MLALDLSSVLQFVLTAIALIAGSLLLVKKAASKYFVVDASFEAGEGYEARHRMSIGGGGGGDGAVPGACAVCGKSATKKCSRCKSVWYCSQACQSKHWEADHKLKCKQASSSDKVDIVLSGNGTCRRRKSSGFGSISLVPTRGTCKVLQVPKKILFPYDEFVKLFNWDKPGFPPCGLLNCGNSCFANVVLQCLSCTRPLIAYLLEKDHSRGCIRKQEDWCFLCELQVHIQRASESRQPFSPINILSRLPNIGGNLGYGSQEDAHEFMRFAIDTMQSVCLDEYGGEKALDPSTQETTLIQHIFGGHLQSQVICTKCNMISNRYENMMDLTVEIHGDAESLEECLDQFTVKEWLDGENMYKCDGCNDYVKAWKRLTVHQAPNILTIALKRFQSGRFGKLNKRVTFPENLDLTPYMSGNGDGTDLYSLYAVVVHVDMLNASFFGHYICYTKDYYGCWYRIDDCKVTMVEVEEVLSQGAYMLLYSRRSARREPFIKPIEPARKKHLALGDTDLSSIPKAANPTSVLASLPSNACSQSNLSLLRDTGHERQLEIKIDATKGKEKEDVELEVPVDVNPKLVRNDLGDVDMDESDLSSSGMKDFEEGNSSQSSLVLQDVLPVNPMESSFISPATPSSAEAKAVECGESDGIFDAGFHIEEGNGSVCISEEVSNLSEYSSEGSFSSKIMVHNMVNDTPETSYSASITSSSAAESETSDDSKPNLERVMVACYPLGSANGVHKLADISCGSEGTKALASSSENGSRAKPKPLFSRGFLDRPAGERSVDHEKRTQAEKPGVAAVPKVNGYSNGHSELYSDVNVASLELISERGKNACHRSDTSFIARGFLNKPYKKSTDKFKIGQTNCNGSAELGSGSEASCSREKASTSTNGTLCAQENGCCVYEKDAASILDLENSSNVGSDYQSKPVSGMCAQYEHGRSGKLNGLATEFLE